MAIEFGKNRTQDFAPANLMSFGKSFSRMGAQPLDMNEVWYNLADLQTYAKTNATAYVGMRLVYVDANSGQITVYAIKNTAGDLVELATAADIQSLENAIAAIEDTNTTYSFSFDKETQKLTVTPSEGAATVLDLSDFLVASELPEDKNTEYHLEYADKAIKLVAGADATKMSIDATPFIKDGMLSDVDYDPASNTLTFVWNTDSGLKADTVVLSDILDPYVAGDKIVIDGSRISHATIAAPALVEGGSGRTYITELVTDGFGHITGYKVATEVDQEIPEDHNDTYSEGNGITISDDGGEAHTVSIQLAPGEKNLVVDANGLATNFDLSNYATNAEAKASNGIRYINQSEIDKLSKLTLDGEDITISGSVEASQVKNLYDTIKNIVTGTSDTEDFDPDVADVQAALKIEVGAEVNKIDSVSDDFDLSATRVLSLKDIDQSKVIGLTDDLTAINNSVKALSDAINGYASESGEQVAGLASRVAALEDSASNYVTVADFNAVVGNLAEMKANNTNIMNDISELQAALKWKIMDDEAAALQ